MMKTKNTTLLLASIALLGGALIPCLLAQTAVTETTTTTTAGTISDFSPETIVVRSETSPEPIRYGYSKTTTYVDETGAPVSIETVKSGLPVTVQYMKVGDRLMASKVIVRKAVVTDAAAPVGKTMTTTTATMTAGTVSEFGPETIIVRSESSPEPIRYTYSKKTTYVDEAGTPVSIETVKSGLPVTVYYTKVGDRMVASKVIVRKAVVADEPVVVKKTTTTTTTTKGKKE